MLSLCAGPDERFTPFFNVLAAAGYDPVHYDLRNGQQCHLVDNAVWEQILYDTASGEYMACSAIPDSAHFSKLHHLPNDPPFLRGLVGKDSHGL